VITETLPEVGPEPEVRRRRGRKLVAIVLVLLLVLGAFALRAWAPWRGTDVRAGTSLVNAEGLAAAYGIDVTLVGLTAAGGMVDFRYQVVDPDKADPVIHDLDVYPKIVVEDTGETLALRTLPHNHIKTLDLGGNYFFLLPNAHNAIHAGTSVTLVIGDVRLEHVIVQG
jgi:hypothetical protein